MKWFGEAWPSPESPAPVCEDPANWVPTPVGEPCFDCGLPIGQVHNGVIIPFMHPLGGATAEPWHLQCFLQSIGVSLL